MEGTSQTVLGFFDQIEGTSQTVLGFFDQMKVPARLSLFLKREKIPGFYVGKGPEYRPFRDLKPTWTTGRGHRSQIMEGPVLRPFSYT